MHSYINESINQASNHKNIREAGVSLQAFLSPPDRFQWTAQGKERVPRIHLIWGCVGPRVGLECVDKKCLGLAGNINLIHRPSRPQPVAISNAILPLLKTHETPKIAMNSFYKQVLPGLIICGGALLW
jgi:hypothetical protein